jgi:hypothetical protein
MGKNKIRVENKVGEIPYYVGRREKCFNQTMDGYFSTTRNNFGPIKIKRSLRKLYEPY